LGRGKKRRRENTMQQFLGERKKVGGNGTFEIGKQKGGSQTHKLVWCFKMGEKDHHHVTDKGGGGKNCPSALVQRTEKSSGETVSKFTLEKRQSVPLGPTPVFTWVKKDEKGKNMGQEIGQTSSKQAVSAGWGCRGKRERVREKIPEEDWKKRNFYGKAWGPTTKPLDVRI